MVLGEKLFSALRQITTRLAAWDQYEDALVESVPSERFFLGGDGLRPYVCFLENERVLLVGVERDGLPLPTLISEILSGTYGSYSLAKTGSPVVYSLSMPASDALAERLKVPTVLLVGLGNRSRYRGLRLPLGIARLSQWLRFTHAARVEVIDYSIINGAEDMVAKRLKASAFDVLGISVNFGQWQMLRDLAIVVNALDYQPVVVLGNILAAFSPAAAASLFAHAPVLVATGLGERPLEQLCRFHCLPELWNRIPGLLRADRKTECTNEQRAEPPVVVFPDDGLVFEVSSRGGQVSLETSFGCQYGKCTFCPRSHRGEGWMRSDYQAVLAVLERLSVARPTANGTPVVSFVDEEFFGNEGLVDAQGSGQHSTGHILETCRQLGIEYELYTRLEQLFDRRRSLQWNISRAQLLARNASQMRRVFVGVESGSPTQLRRYGKGQSVAQIVDSLRIASMLRVPLEFGFITFDPLLSPAEFLENLTFLARQDVLMAPGPQPITERMALVEHYLRGGCLKGLGIPIYTQVAYMATELEVLAKSSYATYLQRRHTELLDGSFDPNFARFGTRYKDTRIQEIAGWCRVWTEGMFPVVYQARMLARSSRDQEVALESSRLVGEYRDATFAIMVGLASAWLPEMGELLDSMVAMLPDRVEKLVYGTDVKRDPVAYLQQFSSVVFEARHFLGKEDLPYLVHFDRERIIAHRET